MSCFADLQLGYLHQSTEPMRQPAGPMSRYSKGKTLLSRYPVARRSSRRLTKDLREGTAQRVGLARWNRATPGGSKVGLFRRAGRSP